MIDENGHSPLLNLVSHKSNIGGLYRCIEALLLDHKIVFPESELSVDVNYQDPSGFNALHYLCMNYQGDDFIDIIQLLVTEGIDVNKTDQESDQNALQLLFQHNTNQHPHQVGYFENIVKYLIENGIHLNHRSRYNGWTALHYLLQHYKHDDLINLVTLLINSGVDVKAKSSDGWTALHILCQKYTHNNLAEIIQLLISNGVDINARTTSKGLTVLHILCQNYTHSNLFDIIKLLLEKNVNINALHTICRFYMKENLIEIVKLIADKGGDIDARTPGGLDSALHYICECYPHKNLIELVRLLIEMGAQASAKTSNGLTPLDLLCQFYTHENLIELVEVLRQEGANIGIEHVILYPRFTYSYLRQCFSNVTGFLKVRFAVFVWHYISPSIAWNLIAIMRATPPPTRTKRIIVLNKVLK